MSLYLIQVWFWKQILLSEVKILLNTLKEIQAGYMRILLTKFPSLVLLSYPTNCSLIYAKTIEDFICAGSFLVKVVRFIAVLQESYEYNCGGTPRLPYEVENCQLQLWGNGSFS